MWAGLVVYRPGLSARGRPGTRWPRWEDLDGRGADADVDEFVHQRVRH
jgi:hypothetical protein